MEWNGMAAFLDVIKAPISSSKQGLNTNITSLPANIEVAFGFGLEHFKLRRFLSEYAKERVNFLYLSGSYNPFIRTLSTPPTHININYLFDPRTYIFNRELNHLFDEHNDGPEPYRADPLIHPMVGRVVFDPNVQPISRETKPKWWKVLYDFYLGDDE